MGVVVVVVSPQTELMVTCLDSKGLCYHCSNSGWCHETQSHLRTPFYLPTGPCAVSGELLFVPQKWKVIQP